MSCREYCTEKDDYVKKMACHPINRVGFLL